MVVVADQNIFGDLWLKYADNYVLFFNAAAWLANYGGGSRRWGWRRGKPLTS